jgi:hypothetical protein
MTNLEQIRVKVEDLQALFSVFMKDMGNLEVQKRVLDEQERNNRIFEKELENREKKLDTEKEALKSEKEFVKEANSKILARELAMEEDKQYLKDIEIAKEDWEHRKQEALTQERIVEDKLKKLEQYKEKEKELEEKESLIAKREAVDIERKKLLDIREERIRIREARLHIEQQE